MFAIGSTPIPPAPSNPEDAARWEHTRHRRALMEGRWQRLLEDRLEAQLGTTRRMAWGIPDMSSNPYKVICTELATLYDAEPDVKHHTAGDVPELCATDGLIARSGLWPMMSRFQALTIALREMWMRIDVEDGRLVYRPVTPDATIAEADPSRPTVPKAFAELRLRRLGGQHVWCWDVLDIRDPQAPRYEVRKVQDGSAHFGEDVTLEVLGGSFSGEAYPYRRADGTPILPVVLYHASAYGDRLFDPYYGIEGYEGSLNLSVFYSFLAHTLRDASYPQRWAIGVRVAGTDLADGNGRGARVEVVSDPTTILMLDAAMEQQPQVGQFSAGADVEKLEATIAAIAHRLATDAGLSPTELQRTSGSAKSGYAISLSAEGKRAAQRKYVMQFRRADEELVQKSAIIYNRAIGTSFPEGGYSVLYREIPLSSEELRGRREHVLAMMEAGLMDRVEALRFFGNMSEQDAAARLAAIDAFSKAPTLPEEGTEEVATSAPAADVSHAEQMSEAAEELDAAAEALEALQVEGASAEVVASVLESLREARAYLGLPASEPRSREDRPEALEEEDTQAAQASESVAAAATSAGVPASAVALNGAQVQAAQGIIMSVAKGELPRPSGVQMLIQFFNMAPEAADALMGEVGRSFTIQAEPVA